MFLVLVFTPQVSRLGRFIDVASEIAVTLESMKQETSNRPSHVRLSLFWMCISTVNLCVCVKRREVSWTLTKKLAQKRSRGGRWCWARKRELDFFCFSCFPMAELRTLSL